MSQILVWKSDADGKLFESKEKYTKHLRGLANQRAQSRKIAKMKTDREAFIVRMGATVTSIKHLEEFIAENWDWFYTNGMAREMWKCNKKPKIKHKLVNIRFENMRWSNNVSNTHSCPRGGVQNWAQSRPENALLPKGYPGWSGHIYFTVDAGNTDHKVPRPLSGWGSSYFEQTVINTGSGSGGSKAQYSVNLFAADFPTMALAREQAQVWSVLSDQDVVQEFA